VVGLTGLVALATAGTVTVVSIGDAFLPGGYGGPAGLWRTHVGFSPNPIVLLAPVVERPFAPLAPDTPGFSRPRTGAAPSLPRVPQPGVSPEAPGPAVIPLPPAPGPLTPEPAPVPDIDPATPRTPSLGAGKGDVPKVRSHDRHVTQAAYGAKPAKPDRRGSSQADKRAAHERTSGDHQGHGSARIPRCRS
jgi:hypothetical protein